MQPLQVTIKQLVFDKTSSDHIWSKHEVTTEQVVGSLADPYLLKLAAKRGRIMTLGRFEGRAIAAIITVIDPDSHTYYCVTARDMSKTERQFYRDTNNLDRNYQPKGGEK